MKILIPLMVLLAAFATNAYAESAPAYAEGTQYERLPIPVQTVDAEKIEVVEVFSYACVHCYTFDPTIEAWHHQLPENVVFHRVPAVFNDTWEFFAQVFYTAEVLGVTEQVHTPLFRAIHAQGVDLRDPNLVAELFQREADVEPATFNDVMNSFSVRGKVQQAKALGRAYRITGVPSLVVQGEFKIDGRMAGNNTQMLAVADYLIATDDSQADPAQAAEEAAE